MPSGDTRKPNNPNQGPDSHDGGSQQPGRTPETPQGDATGARESVDFGSYVSSTVRSSSELFGTPARSSSRNRPPRRTTQPPATSAPANPPPDDAPEDGGYEAPPSRPRRNWRDSVSPHDEVDYEDERATGGGDGGSGGGVLPWTFRDGDRPSNGIIAGVAIAILAIILLIWFLNRGDGDGGDPTPTPTQQTVITAPTETETSGETPSTPPAFIRPTQDDNEPTPTSEVRRGGDNQRNNDDGTPASDVNIDDIEPGPVARQCPERCLVRFAVTGDIDMLMTTGNTRASFVGDDWVWAVASPQAIAWFEQNTETVLVSDSPDTLSLYVALSPSEETTTERVAQVGSVIDNVGHWSVFEASRVPPNVKPLTDWGYQVDKMAPPPPLEIGVPEEPTQLGSIEIGSLMDDVSSDNIQSTIEDLVAMGSHDGSGIGTRYYTTAANMQAAEYLYGRLESYGLTVWYEDFLSWEGYLMVNVIGEVPGEDASSVYAVMAHFDTISSDLNTAPGADDNATGVSASLEIARILSAYQLHHPVRILFVNVEEVGIVGSEQLAKRAQREGTPYEGVFNLDSVGAQRQYNYLVVNGSADTAWMIDLYRRINDAYGLDQVINAQTNGSIRADDDRLRDNGFDAIMVARELYGQSPYHHTPGDTIDTLRIEGVVSCTQLTLLSLADLARV